MCLTGTPMCVTGTPMCMTEVHMCCHAYQHAVASARAASCYSEQVCMRDFHCTTDYANSLSVKIGEGQDHVELHCTDVYDFHLGIQVLCTKPPHACSPNVGDNSRS